MNADEKKTALKNIANVIPSVVFDRLINILTRVEGCNNDMLVAALGKASINPAYIFTYLMKTNESKETITPIREILDLCEGWFITSTSTVSSGERVRWNVKSLIGKELPE